jgi:glucosylceramidase
MNPILFSLSALSLSLSVVSCSPTVSMDGPIGSGGGNVGSGGGGPVGTGGGGPAGTGGNGPTSGGAPGTGAAGNTGGQPGTGGVGAAGTGGGAPVVVDRPPLVTSGPAAYWMLGEPTAASGAATVTVNDTPLRKWKGFGGTFNEAGWDALKELTAEERDRAIRLLFSPSEGANFKWGRIPMGASDYALSRYTLCDECTPDNVETNFSIARDELDLIPYILAAKAVKSDILFWGSPWTPPAWMKTPQQIDGLPGDAEMNGTAANLQALATYQARWVEEYEAKGIDIHHVQPQNEPGYASRYPSCLWDSGVLATFVGDYLGPTFTARQVPAEIWFGTLSNNNTYSGQIGTVFSGSANAFVKGVGLQWNTYPHIGELQSAHPDLIIMQTEHRCGNYRFSVTDNPIQNPPANTPLPPNDHAYMVESWGWFIQWIGGGVNAYSAWNMILDTVGANLDAEDPWEQNALLLVDRDTDELIETPTYYLFKHLSYFVDPEADVLGTSGGSALAFKNPDGSTVAVVYSSGGGTVTVALGGQTLSAEVPAQGFATFYVEGS